MPMSSHQQARVRRARPLGALLLAAWLAFTVYACVSDRDVPTHGWWEDRGPVVRHETFPEDCSLCHKGKSWSDLVEDFVWDHQAQTGYALNGAHGQAKCLRCHNDRGPVQLFERQGCSGCHEDVHRGLLGSECTKCHTEDDWVAHGQIAEHRRTRFPLTGAHMTTPCWRCHEAAERGEFSREDTRCEACHADDIAMAIDPNHFALGWDNSCERCHLTTTWGSAGFKHFALSTNCDTCHIAEYQAATNPVHTFDFFPQKCEYCHLNETWTPAKLDHPFPRVGFHEPFTCEQCHTPAGNFQGFSCTHCHWHELRNESYRHMKVRDYVWENQACIDCHPSGFVR